MSSTLVTPANSMIILTRLNGETFTLNATMIEQIQSFPDTTITLINGKMIVVQNPESEVTELIIKFYQNVGFIGSQHRESESFE